MVVLPLLYYYYSVLYTSFSIHSSNRILSNPLDLIVPFAEFESTSHHPYCHLLLVYCGQACIEPSMGNKQVMGGRLI